MKERHSIHGTWASRWVFILAATGSAVGLGNIWKFPYITGENGGGAFVLVYLVCLLLVGVPIMMAETLVGRRGRCSPINAIRETANESGRSSRWRVIGWMATLSAFLIFSFYSVVAGWVLNYIVGMGRGDYVDIGKDQAAARFDLLLADPRTMLIWHSVFVLLVMLVVVGGVNKGLERAAWLLMPLFFALLALLLGYSFTTGYFFEGLQFLFHFSPQDVTWDSVLLALGHSFFTLSLGLGAILAYGAYMPKQASIGGSVMTVALLDTLVALVAGMAIFPIVFANELDPEAGPGLMFITLPVAFGQMPGGQWFGLMFFVLVAVAAWTSSISLMEPATAWLVERFKLKRLSACFLLGVAGWAMGIASLGSFNVLSEYKLLGMTTFYFLDFITANVMLPLGGLLLATYVGWFMQQPIVEDELAMGGKLRFQLWYWVLRLIAPVAVIIIFTLNLNQKLA